jgi:hypothetical protein
MDDVILELFNRAEVFAASIRRRAPRFARVAERRAFSAGEVVFVEGAPSEYALWWSVARWRPPNARTRARTCRFACSVPVTSAV